MNPVANCDLCHWQGQSSVLGMGELSDMIHQRWDHDINIYLWRSEYVALILEVETCDYTWYKVMCLVSP